ncbi:MAG: hypothetical protein ACRERU_01285 [Methylococcales bacterium]
MTSSGFADTRRDVQDILQLVLNTPQLTQYYHFDQRPERIPLRIVNLTPLDIGNPDLTAAGQKVLISTERSDRAIEITAFTIADSAAELAFTFGVEGVVGRATLKRVLGKWSFEKLSVAEK